MKGKDPALSFPNPRMLAAIYYGLLSVVATIMIDALISSIGINEVIPIYQSVLIGMAVASSFGALYGEVIIFCPKPYWGKTFWMGFSMIMASLPLFILGVLLMMQQENTTLFVTAKLHNIVYVYLVMLGYSYVVFGFFLGIACGLASMYLRGQLVYDILHVHKNEINESKGRKTRKKVSSEDKAHISHR